MTAALALPEADVLQTDRLTLRLPTFSDIGAISERLNDPMVMRMMGVLPWPYTRDHARAFVARVGALPAGGRECVRAISRDGEVIGIIRIGPRDGHLFLSYWLGQSEWRQGYMSEAIPAMLSHYFGSRDIETLYADYYCDNDVSAHLLSKFGFRPVSQAMVHSEFRGQDALEICTRLSRARFEELNK